MATATERTITPAQARAVSSHRPQTLLVAELLETGFLDWSDVRNLGDPETGDERAIYEWHLFPDF